MECEQLQLAQSRSAQGSCPSPLGAGALGEQNEDWRKRNTSNNYQPAFQALLQPAWNCSWEISSPCRAAGRLWLCTAALLRAIHSVLLCWRRTQVKALHKPPVQRSFFQSDENSKQR